MRGNGSGARAAGSRRGWSAMRTARVRSTPTIASSDPQHSRLQQSSSRARLGQARPRPRARCEDRVSACRCGACSQLRSSHAALLAKRFTGTPIVYSAHNTMHESSRPTSSNRWRGAWQVVGAVLDRTVPRLAEHAVMLADEAEVTLRNLGCHEVTKVAPGVDFSELEDVVPAGAAGGAMGGLRGQSGCLPRSVCPHGAMRRLDGVGLLMVSASCLDDWAQIGLPKFMAVQTSDFGQRSEAPSPRRQMWQRFLEPSAVDSHQAAQHTGARYPDGGGRGISARSARRGGGSER